MNPQLLVTVPYFCHLFYFLPGHFCVRSFLYSCLFPDRDTSIFCNDIRDARKLYFLIEVSQLQKYQTLQFVTTVGYTNPTTSVTNPAPILQSFIPLHSLRPWHSHFKFSVVWVFYLHCRWLMVYINKCICIYTHVVYAYVHIYIFYNTSVPGNPVPSPITACMYIMSLEFFPPLSSHFII